MRARSILIAAFLSGPAAAAAAEEAAPVVEVRMTVTRVDGDSVEAKYPDGKPLVLRRSAFAKIIAVGELKTYEVSLQEWSRARSP